MQALIWDLPQKSSVAASKKPDEPPEEGLSDELSDSFDTPTPSISRRLRMGSSNNKDGNRPNLTSDALRQKELRIKLAELEIRTAKGARCQWKSGPNS